MDSKGKDSASPPDARDESAPFEPPPHNRDPSEDRDERTTEDVIHSLHVRFGELFDFAVYYLVSRIDAAKLYVKRKILWLSVIALAVLACAGATVTAVVLLCAGIADGLSELFGHRWAGELATGIILLGATAGAGSLLMNRLVGQSHQERIAKFEAMRARHRRRHGRDIADVARESQGEAGHE
jgi:hypothetical protein